MNPTTDASIDQENGTQPLRNIKLTVAYDGTDFSGWQMQQSRSGEKPFNKTNRGKKNRTVQGEIEKALEKIHKHPVTLIGSGRTDSGVHAAGQVANFYTSIKNMRAGRFVPALNGILERDIRILRAEEARQDFHARFDAKSRTYRYYFISGRPALPWELRGAVQLWHRPNLAKLNDLASLLKGEQNCTVFAPPGDKSSSRSRYIYGASFFIEGDKLVFEITANAFLWKMVRYAAGTLIRFEKEGIPPSRFKEILALGDRALAGPTAPPNGLFLWKIDFWR